MGVAGGEQEGKARATYTGLEQASTVVAVQGPIKQPSADPALCPCVPFVKVAAFLLLLLGQNNW